MARFCSVILDTGDKRMILQLRDNNPTINFPNTWGTFGGHVEAGETSEEAIRREVREELNGLELSQLEFSKTFYSSMGGRAIDVFRAIEPTLDVDQLVVLEGQRASIFTREELGHLVFSDVTRDIVFDHVATYW